MATNRKRVAVCSQEKAFSSALRIVLAEHEVSVIVSLDELAGEPDALIYRVDGSWPAQGLAEIAAHIPTVALGDEEHLIPAVDANCRGFVLRDEPLEKIAGAVDTVLEGGAVIPPDLLGALLRHIVIRRRQGSEVAIQLDELTDRESQVFWLAADGLRKEEIGEKLYISPDTARTHLQRIYRKLGLHSQSELMALAARIDRDGVRK